MPKATNACNDLLALIFNATTWNLIAENDSVKPIIEIPLPVTGIMTERDLRSQLVSLPQIADGACLSWLLFGTGATTTASPFTAVAEYSWGG